MRLGLIGINYASAPLEILESLHCRRAKIAGFWKDHNVSLLFTCNRIEIYTPVLKFSSFLAEFREFKDYAYLKSGSRDVFLHALRVATGLDSQIRGEKQIFSQIKDLACRQDYGSALNTFWQKIISCAQEIRIISGLSQEDFNIVDLVLDDLLEQGVVSDSLKVLIIGTGKVAGLFAAKYRLFKQLIFIAHKNFSQAKKLADSSNGKVLFYNQLGLALQEADLLVNAAKCPHYILWPDNFSSLRRVKPLLAYDLSLPRTIHPRAQETQKVILKNLSQLSGRLEKQQRRIDSRIKLAEYLALEKVREIFDGQEIKDWYSAESFGK